MLELTFEKAQELVDAAIAERGEDYVYSKQAGSCLYVHSDSWFHDERGEWVRVNEKPGCIVGVALVNLGVGMDELVSINTLDASAALQHLEQRGVWVETEAVDFLSRVQVSQDNGMPWGEARDRANLGQVYSKSSESWISYNEYLSGP